MSALKKPGAGDRAPEMRSAFPVAWNGGASGFLSAHLFERPDADRADGPEDDRQAELHERWFGWGEDWTLEP